MKTTLLYHEGIIPSDTMLESILSQIFLTIQSMPRKRLDIRQINIYRNSDVNNRATYMMVLDAYLFDAKYDVRKENMLKKIFNVYNSTVGETSKAYITKPKSKKRGRKAKSQNKVAFMDMFNIKTRADLNETKTARAIRKYADKNGMKVGDITAGIGRSLTIRARK